MSCYTLPTSFQANELFVLHLLSLNYTEITQTLRRSRTGKRVFLHPAYKSKRVRIEGGYIALIYNGWPQTSPPILSRDRFAAWHESANQHF